MAQIDKKLVVVGALAVAGGVGAALLMKRYAPYTRAMAKLGGKTLDRVQLALEETKEDFEDMMAEARYEMELEQQRRAATRVAEQQLQDHQVNMTESASTPPGSATH
jgi:hypothetical protein